MQHLLGLHNLDILQNLAFLGAEFALAGYRILTFLLLLLLSKKIKWSNTLPLALAADTPHSRLLEKIASIICTSNVS